MSRQFDVVGYTADGEEVYGGDVMGDVMGDAAPAAHHHRRHGGHRMMKIAHKPNWRDQMAPGVIQPDEGMVPLPLAPQGGSPLGFFTSAISQITFQGQLQKPFRPERLLVSTVRTGTSATGRLLTQLFVGTDLQGADITQWDAELVGQANAFGTRLTAKAAEPGVFVRLVITLSNNITVTTDSIFASMMFLGRIIH